MIDAKVAVTIALVALQGLVAFLVLCLLGVFYAGGLDIPQGARVMIIVGWIFGMLFIVPSTIFARHGA